MKIEHQNEFLSGPSYNSMLLILDDKNNEIAVLKRQVENQKLQLGYYIQKQLDLQKVQQLSKECVPSPSQISIPLNFAINKFYKNNGLKNKTTLLYNYMKDIDKKINLSLSNQESLLSGIIGGICKLVRQATKDMKFIHFIADSHQLELFNYLLNATKGLRKELNLFRNCCNRLIVVEEERNSIVEQVFALPVEERINCNYIIKMQMEKIQLQSEMQEILDNQKILKNKIIEMTVMENRLKKMESRYNISTNTESMVTEMLEKVNSQAITILERSEEIKKWKEHQQKETKSNNDLEKILLNIPKLFEDNYRNIKPMTENALEIQFYKIITNEISEYKDRIHKKFSKNYKEKCAECKYMHEKMTRLDRINKQFKMELMDLKKVLDETQTSSACQIERISLERDLYKTQVDDLQAIRAAYAQLVERQVDIAELEKGYQKEITRRDQKISELAEQNDIYLMESKYQKSYIKMQSNQIHCLTKLIDKFKSNNGNVNRFLDDTTQSVENIEEELFEVNNDDLYCSPKKYSNFKSKKNPPEITKVNIPNCLMEIPETKFTIQSSLNSQFLSETKEVESRKTSSVNSLEIPISCPDNGSFSVKALLQIEGDISGNIEFIDHSTVCLKLFAKDNMNLSIKDNSVVYDEDEEILMKDCSNESVAVTCPLVKKSVKSLENSFGGDTRLTSLQHEHSTTEF